jgi:thiamine biosynthesis lipoprotein
MKRRSFITLLATGPLLASCYRSAGQVTLSGATMGTGYNIKLSPLPRGVSGFALQTEIEQVLSAVKQTMSTYDRQSELSRFNRSDSGTWIGASADLLTVLDNARRISVLSGGAFDASVGPLVNLWGFGPDGYYDGIPTDARIADTLDRIGYRQLQIDSQKQLIRKAHSAGYIDLSSIAKGYGVDRVAALLEAKGIENYLVEIGGDMRLKGYNDAQQRWRIAVEEPTPGVRRIERILNLTDKGLATSGDYRNFFERDGRRYSHIIDPLSGWPVKHPLASVTVIADDAMQADALATALLVLGPEKGYQLAQQQNLAALFITVDGERFAEIETPALRGYLDS